MELRIVGIDRRRAIGAIVMEDLEVTVAAARGGDFAAFATLVDRFRDMAYGAAMSKLGDAHLAEDAAQEAFIEAYRHLKKLEEPKAFPGWFRVIVYRKAARFLHKHRRKATGLEDAAATLACPLPTPADRAVREESRQQLHEALNELTDAQRVVTTLYYLNSYNTAEIATCLGLEVSAVKKRLHDARRRLHRNLGSQAIERPEDMIARQADPTGTGREPIHAEPTIEEVRAESREQPRPTLGRHRRLRAKNAVKPGDKPISDEMGMETKREAREHPEAPSGSAPEPAEQRSSEPPAPEPAAPTVVVNATPEQIFRPVDPEAELAELWRRYKERPSETDRNRLLEHYLPLVKHHAQRLAKRLPDIVRLDDLMSGGVMGLMDAVESFDITKGVRFEAFSNQRIRGAILDELRSMDWVPRLVRIRASKLAEANERMAQRLQRLPTDEELIGFLDVDRAEYRRIVRDADMAGLVSLSKALMPNESDGKELFEIDVLIDRQQANPLTTAERLDLKQQVQRGLSRAERLILTLYYYEHLTMREIANTLDLSESRVSQMHTSIMQRLKARFGEGSSEAFEDVA